MEEIIMAMVIQNNLNAINANNKLAINVAGTKKATEKLSSGFRINRAADDAAGLAISEKMRAQLRGLGQAIRNANDGISLIQTAEGALDETHAMLKRLKELSVQAGNETYTDEERKYMQMEIDRIKEEVDRISIATDFNGIKLLDGSLSSTGGMTNSFGADFGVRIAGGAASAAIGGTGWDNAAVIANISGAHLLVGTNVATGVGEEFATWDATGRNLTLQLATNTVYTEARINEIIASANRQPDSQSHAPTEMSVKLFAGQIMTGGTSAAASIGTTVAGVNARSTFTAVGTFFGTGATGQLDSIDEIRFLSNSYGIDQTVVRLDTTGAGPAGTVTLNTAATNPITNAGRVMTLHLATGTDYSAQDIEKMLNAAGLDYRVEFNNLTTGSFPSTGADVFRATAAATVAVTMASGAGVGNDITSSGGQGITFQIGANNAVEQRVTLNISDMGASALGIAGMDVSSVKNAQKAMDSVEAAIVKVSEQRAALGAMQNRLEHTVNSLTVTHENLTAAESQIRDTDMAKEMVEYTKYNILQQAAQAMLAQANQAPQAILQLLR